jgi:chromosome partitioning protein
MQTIVVNSQKGGSGKTALCKLLAVEAEHAGDGPVYLIDTDPQGSLTAWHRKREAETPVLADLPLEGLARGLAAIRARGASYCIIDTASGRIDVATELFKLADFVIFPVKASIDDIAAAPLTVKNIKAARKPFLFVINQVKPGTRLIAQTAAILSKHGPVAETFVAERTAYRSPYPKGQTIIEAEPKGRAALEIAALWRDIKACMHESMRSSTE